MSFCVKEQLKICNLLPKYMRKKQLISPIANLLQANSRRIARLVLQSSVS